MFVSYTGTHSVLTLQPLILALEWLKQLKEGAEKKQRYYVWT